LLLLPARESNGVTRPPDQDPQLDARERFRNAVPSPRAEGAEAHLRRGVAREGDHEGVRGGLSVALEHSMLRVGSLQMEIQQHQVGDPGIRVAKGLLKGRGGHRRMPLPSQKLGTAFGKTPIGIRNQNVNGGWGFRGDGESRGSLGLMGRTLRGGVRLIGHNPIHSFPFEGGFGSPPKDRRPVECGVDATFFPTVPLRCGERKSKSHLSERSVPLREPAKRKGVELMPAEAWVKGGLVLVVCAWLLWDAFRS